MGRNRLFVKEAVTSASNMNFIHRKGEGSAIQANEPFPEVDYFQEDTIDVEVNPEDEIRKYRFSDDGRQLVVMTDDEGNPKHDSSGDPILIPGKTPTELQGITLKYKFRDGTVKRATVLKPLENNLTDEKGLKLLKEFNIQYDSDQVNDTMAYNEIMNYLHRDELDEEGHIWSYRKVLAHTGPFTNKDKEYKGSSYNVLIEWENGDVTEEPLNWMIKENAIPIAQYAKENNLLNTPGWKSLKKIPKREKLLERLVNQAKLGSFRTSPKYMYGYQVPKDYAEAMLLDKQNGNTRWADCTDLELQQMQDYHVFIDKGLLSDTGIPIGFKKIRVHLIYAVKHDGRHKARLVADGHLTDIPLNSVYAGVVSICGMRICLFLGELNDMEAYATDIGNAYLEAKHLRQYVSEQDQNLGSSRDIYSSSTRHCMAYDLLANNLETC